MPSVMPDAAAAAARTRLPSLASWLFAATLLATLAAVLLATGVIERLMLAQARGDATQLLQAHADALRDALDRGMAQHYEEVRVIAALDAVARAGDAASARRALDGFKRSFPQFAWLGLTDADGKVLAAADGLLEGVDVSRRPWFAGARDGMYVGDVHKAVLLEKLLPRQAEPWRFVDVAAPVRGADGRLQGVVGAHLSWTWAARLKHDLADNALAAVGGEALVLGADGTVLLGPQALEGQRRDAAQDRGWLLAQSRSQGRGDYPGLGWQVVLRQPERVALARFDALRLQALVASMVVVALLAPLLWLLAHRLAGPLDRLAHSIGSAAPGSVAHARYREAALLAQALQRDHRRQAEHEASLLAMAGSLEQRVTERTAALAEANDRLAAAFGELAHSRQRIASILQHAPDAFIALDDLGRVTDWNAAAERMLGWTRDEALGQPLSALIIPEAQRAAHDAGLRRFAASGQGPVVGQRIELAAQRRDGALLPVELSVGALRRDEGFVAFAFLHDISERKAAQASIAAREKQLRDITDNLPVLITYMDRHERFTFANRTIKEWLGLEPAQALGRTLREVVGEALYTERRAQLALALGGERTSFEVVSRAAGTTRHLKTVYVPDVQADGSVAGLYTLSSDITAMKLAEQRLEQLARVDALTGLANRREFEHRLAEAIARSSRTGRPMGLVFLDVDHFKQINDTLGHGGGDEVLKQFAQRVQQSVRLTDTAARLAGDEFVVILEGLNHAAEAEQVARKLGAAIRQPMEVAGQARVVTASIGVAYCGGDAEDEATPASIVERADRALYRAKAAGRDTFAATMM